MSVELRRKLADILEENAARFAEVWLERPQIAAVVPVQQLDVAYRAMVAVLRGGPEAPWKKQLHALGMAMAVAQVQMNEVVAEALAFMGTLRGVTRSAFVPGSDQAAAWEDEIAGLQNIVLGELLGGYAEDQERRADELQIALDEVNALHKIISAANSSLQFQAVIDQVVQTVRDVMRVDVCSIFIYEPQLDMLVLRATQGLSPDMIGKLKLRLGEGVTGSAGRTGKPVSLANAWDDPRFVHVPFLGEEGTNAMLAVPVVVFTKLKLVGVISLQSAGERVFGDREVKFLETVAGEIAIAIENARLYGETDARLHQKVTELTTLQGVSATIAATLNLREVLNLIAMEAARLVNVDAALVYELREGVLEPMAGFGFVAEAPAQQRQLTASETTARSTYNGRAGEGLAQQRGVRFPVPTALPDRQPNAELITMTVQKGRTLFIGRGGASGTGGQPSLSGSAEPHTDRSAPPAPYACEFCVPLAAPRGVVGAICLFSRGERHFSGEQVSLLEAFAREGAIAIENARLFESTRHGLEMKTLLLREMHHRVRNNLQRTASLLRMQSQRLPADSPALIALQESVIRIQSIARVHDLLSREQIGITDIIAVANLAIEVVSNTLARPDQRIHWRSPATPVPLSSQEAFPLTLLLTELLSNSVLHGFASREEGNIAVKATLEGDALRIVVQDDGRGLDENFNLARSTHLGLEVVRRLGEQELGGVLRVEPADPGPGTMVTLLIPYNPPHSVEVTS